MKVERVRDIVVGEGGGRDLKADLYRPETPNGAGVLAIHGGGWRMGDREMMPPQCDALASVGFTCLAIEYRLTPEAPWPAQLHDVKTAMRWFRLSGEDLGIRDDGFGVLGNSAGDMGTPG